MQDVDLKYRWKFSTGPVRGYAKLVLALSVQPVTDGVWLVTLRYASCWGLRWCGMHNGRDTGLVSIPDTMSMCNVFGPEFKRHYLADESLRNDVASKLYEKLATAKKPQSQPVG